MTPGRLIKSPNQVALARHIIAQIEERGSPVAFLSDYLIEWMENSDQIDVKEVNARVTYLYLIRTVMRKLHHMGYPVERRGPRAGRGNLAIYVVGPRRLELLQGGKA